MACRAFLDLTTQPIHSTYLAHTLFFRRPHKPTPKSLKSYTLQLLPLHPFQFLLQRFFHSRHQLRRLPILEFAPLALPKHGETPIPRLAIQVRPRHQMVMHMRHHLARRGPVVLHDVPVPDARHLRHHLAEPRDPDAELGGFGRHDVGDLLAVRARRYEEVPGREGHDVEEGEAEGRGEDDEGGGCGLVVV